ncbi:unnamed protein product [Rhodiola kirilowii]
MLEESTWGVMSSWFTPTMLFVYMNFMIATIFVTSGFGSHKQQQQQQPHQLNNTDLQQQENQTQPFLQRSPSVLQRLKSINFYQYTNSYRSHEYATVSSVEAPTQMMPVKAVCPPEDEDDDEYEEEDRFEHEEEKEDEGRRDKSIEDVYGKLHVSRTKSDTEPASGAVPVKLVKKMKKSASSNSAFRHFSEAEIVEARRPATTREAKAAAEKEDEEVDSKADDFINKFKQQLKLQRLDSILRYKEMLGRGAAK